MNCGNNNSGYTRMNRNCGNTRPSCESSKPSCGDVRSSCENTKSNCGCGRTMTEYTRPSCNYERVNEAAESNCGRMPMNEAVESINVEDCSCQEFMRIFDWYNCTTDKASREFMEAEKDLNDAIECIKMGLAYNEKAKDINTCMDEFLDAMNEENVCDKQATCGNARNDCNTRCNCDMRNTCSSNCNNSCSGRCNNSCNTNCACACNVMSMNSCTQGCSRRNDPCMQMRAELKEMICDINKVEEESLEHAQQAVDKLMEAQKLRKCACELKSKVARNCFPKC
ncbi:hypothetical protein [Anaerosporobacter sp.]|uniref:hypothetical protein n=1 Tax=Anaerosporobacter sp. TaxID=1872529 RepID=UPI00286F1F66|nr:hypothetical protein [Anaerosporobacter sp.]